MAALTWQGEFVSPLLERRYRIASWTATAMRMRFLCGFTSALYLMVAVADYLAHGPTPMFYAILSLRLTCFALGWGTVVLSFSRRFMGLLPWAVALYFLSLGSAEAVQAAMLSPAPSDGQLLFTICLVLAFYIFLPPSLLPTILGAVGATLVYLLAVATQTSAPQLLTATLFLLFINGFGIHFLREANFSSRRVYQALREERLLSRRLRRETAERRKAQAQLQLLATTDDMTGLFNRRRFLALCRSELARFERYGLPVALLLLDVDKLKHINDSHGHATGDLVLQTLANRCTDHLRTTDMPGRLGGEEFGFLLPCTSLEDAAGVAEKLCTMVAAQPMSLNGLNLQITVSIGVAAASPKTHTPEDLLQEAEQALDLAKEQGRNRACSSLELSDKAPLPHDPSIVPA